MSGALGYVGGKCRDASARVVRRGLFLGNTCFEVLVGIYFKASAGIRSLENLDGIKF